MLAELVSATKDAAVVRTWRTQAPVVLLLNTAVQPAVLTPGTVHLIATPAT